MAIKLATAYVQIVPSMKGVGKAISDAFDKNSSAAGISGGKAAGAGFASGMRAKMGAVIGAASAITSKAMSTIASSIGSAISRADQMNNFPKVMSNLGYSSEDAAKSIKKISDSLDGLPTTSSAMTGMVQQLAPLTSSLDEATTISLAFNNAMLAGGASTIEQENALAQYTQMLAAGKVDMAAWRSIQAAMPGQLNQVAESMLGAGKNANDLYDAMKDGTVGFDEFNKAIVDLNENGFGQYASFAQQAKDATQGIGTAFENVQNRVAKAMQKVIEAIGVEQIAGAINQFSSQFGKIGDAAANMVTKVKDQFGQMVERLDSIDAFASLRNAWKTLTDTIGGIDWGSLLPTKVWEGFSWTAASAISDVFDRVNDLATILSDGIQWVTDFIQAFNDTGVWDAWIDAFGYVLDFLRDAWGAFGDIIDYIGDMTGLTGSAQSFGDTMGNIFKGIADAVEPVIKALDDLVNWCGQHAGAVTTAIAGVAGAFGAFKATQGISTAIDVLKGMSGPVNDLRAAFDLIVDSGGLVNFVKEAGGLSGALGMLPGKVGQLAGTFSTLKGNSTGVISTMKALSGALGLGPWGLLAGAIGAVVSALVWFFTQTETGRKIWQAFTDWLGKAWQWLCDTASSVFGALGDFFSNLWNGISSVAENVWNGISSFFGGIWDSISNAFTSAWKTVSSVWDSVWNGIKTVFEAVWNGIVGFVNTVIMPIVEFIKNCFIVLAAVFVTIWNSIKAVFMTVWNAIVAFITPIIQTIQTGIQLFLTTVQTIWDTVWTAVSTFFQTIWQAIVDFVTPIIEAIQTGIETFCTTVQTVWDTVWGAISSFFQSIWQGIIDFVTPIIEAISSTISNVITGIQNTWNNIWNGISSFFSNIWNNMKNAVSNAIGSIGDKVRSIKDTVMNALKGAGEWLRDTGKNLIQGLINGIGDMFSWVKDKICNLGSNILGWAKDVLGIGSPSKIFKQYGQWLDEGLALGIKGATGDVKQQMDELTGMVADTPLNADWQLNTPNMPTVRPYDTSKSYSNTDDTSTPRGGVNMTVNAQGLSAQELMRVMDLQVSHATAGWGGEYA